ncbi:hypothetical protein [Streptomyces sp. G-G2]|uniref:hypothetical protein n=1 Tax=Streptomyces sp. G-G2 TaxID=3046201 RepID=UPI0024B8DAFC|nr:hypothetical protein [Streptomyces sp. G-G2]MDJ0386076.1 hypothetical protein [Streptomyces sp. G-G2]
MDPVTVGLLVALAGGAGGELGRQAWAGLGAVVRRPFRREDGGQALAISSGEVELERLDEEPADQGRAQALSMALAVRAAVDADFRDSLAAWLERAAWVQDSGAVTNTASGTHNGPVVQGRDFTNLTFTTAPPPTGTSADGVPGQAR